MLVALILFGDFYWKCIICVLLTLPPPPYPPQFFFFYFILLAPARSLLLQLNQIHPPLLANCFLLFLLLLSEPSVKLLRHLTCTQSTTPPSLILSQFVFMREEISFCWINEAFLSLKQFHGSIWFFLPFPPLISPSSLALFVPLNRVSRTVTKNICVGLCSCKTCF